MQQNPDDQNLTSTARLAVQLLQIASVTPDDKGCNQLLMERLAAIGFHCEVMRFGEVNNFWARLGSSGPVLCFAGHTDVVPTGPEDNWQSPPFTPTLRDGLLYARGAADMKGSLAAMVTACESFVRQCDSDGQQPAGSIAFLITGDEEGAAINGTRKVIEALEARSEKITWCIVGEPSSTETLGDVVKIGRRGSLHGLLTVRGVQGHVAYPHLATNPIHQAMRPLDALVAETWDNGNEAFPPTTFQISNISSGTGASNVIPGVLTAAFNFRFSTELTENDIRERTEAILDAHGIDYDLQWNLSGLPFLTRSERLIQAVTDSVQAVNGVTTQASTAGGTSDGRFIAPTGAEVVELGPCNASIHKVDEHVRLTDLDDLSLIYEEILRRLLLN
jgi:succinyl-diaminopimelate desuccinylase